MNTIEERIEHVINRLLPATHLDNRFAAPATLTERMAHYQTPGVSIAVINHYEIEWVQGFGLCEQGSLPLSHQTLSFKQAPSASRCLRWQGHPLVEEIERAIAKEYGWPGYFPEQATRSLSVEQMAGYVGTYQSDSGAVFTITQIDNALWLQPPAQPTFQLHLSMETKFTTRHLNAEVSFAQNEAGEATLTLHQGGGQFVMKKQKEQTNE